MPLRSRSSALMGRVLAVALVAVGVPVLLVQSPAAAAAWGVSSTADTPVGQACAGFTGCSLREAVEAAEANPGADAVLISAGTYTLTNGPLTITQGLSISRVGAGGVTIDGGGGTVVTLTGTQPVDLRFLRVTGATSSPAVVATAGSSLTVESTTFADNHGGAIQVAGGDLTIARASGSLTGSVFSGNSATSGGAVDFAADDAGDALAISDTTFSANSSAQTGGAVRVQSQPGAMTLIDRTTFSGNTAGSFGGALFQLDGSLRLTHSTLIDNVATYDGGAVFRSPAETDTYTYNRFYGNYAPDDDVTLYGGVLDLQRNWWGCNGGPGATGCETVRTNVGTVADTDPWLVFGASGPSTVEAPDGTAPVTAGITADSNGDPVATADLDMLDGVAVFWSALPGAATIGSPTALDDTGVTSTVYSSQSAPAGPGSATATVDGQSVTVPFTVHRAPHAGVAITSFPDPVVYGQDTRATATVSGATGGMVQFALDGTNVGSPVPLTAGSATSPDLGPEPGDHVVSATLTSDSASPPASNSTPLHVVKADTTTVPSVEMVTLTAAVAAVAPGSGTPDGEVTFSVDGEPVGTAPVVDGEAELVYPTPDGDHEVTAVYSGSDRYTPSDGSVTRSDPVLTAAVTSRIPPTSFGWYRTPVRVTFTCQPTTAPLAGPCPKPVRLTASAPRIHVDETIGGLDGGYASVTVVVSLDRRDPTLRVRTTRTGELRCVAHDRLSGIDACTVTTTRRGYRAVAVDKAGNRTVVRGPRRR